MLYQLSRPVELQLVFKQPPHRTQQAQGAQRGRRVSMLPDASQQLPGIHVSQLCGSAKIRQRALLILLNAIAEVVQRPQRIQRIGIVLPGRLLQPIDGFPHVIQRRFF